MLLAATTDPDGVRRARPEALTSPIAVSPSAYRWEADMTQPVVERVSRLLPRSRSAHVVVGEVPAAIGIVDVVAAQFDPDAVRHRLKHGVGPLCSPLRVRVLDGLRDQRPRRIATIAQRVHSNPRALMRSTLVPLADAGLVEMTERSVLSTGRWRPVGVHLTAIELKLSKWRDALRQADNFGLSADRSWVVLDEKRARGGMTAMSQFEQRGVGLAVLRGDGRIRVVVRPGRRQPDRWLKALMSERAWTVAESELAAAVTAC